MLFSPIDPNFYDVAINPAMHIPDGFLNLTISIIFWVITVLFIGIAVQRTKGELGERQVPLMGIIAAFIFAAQMINFPVAGGTSGHFLGGALAGIILGPWAGILVMTAVIGLQALLFQRTITASVTGTDHMQGGFRGPVQGYRDWPVQFWKNRVYHDHLGYSGCFD